MTAARVKLDGRVKCPECVYTAANAASIAAHTSMVHKAAEPVIVLVPEPSGRMAATVKPPRKRKAAPVPAITLGGVDLAGDALTFDVPTGDVTMIALLSTGPAREDFDLDPDEPTPEPWSEPEPTEHVKHPTREAWMLAAVDLMRDRVNDATPDVDLGPVRISFGWPGGRGSKHGVRGQCWMPAAVKDAVPAIFVSPDQEDIPTILGIILHEMNHAIGHFGHTGAFAKVARTMGFVKPYTSSEGKTPELVEYLAGIAEKLGPIDHGQITAGHGLQGNGPQRPPVQSTRMLKVSCDADGYTMRATSKWLTIAIPACPICDDTMRVEQK